jgi:hypothetical protein
VKARAHASRCRKVRGSCPTKRDIAVADGGGKARAHSHSRALNLTSAAILISPSLDAMEQSRSARVRFCTQQAFDACLDKLNSNFADAPSVCLGRKTQGPTS